MYTGTIDARVFYPTARQRQTMYCAAMDMDPMTATTAQHTYVLALAVAHQGSLRLALLAKADMMTRAIAARHTRAALQPSEDEPTALFPIPQAV